MAITRTVALALIAVLAGGLAYLRVDLHSDGTISVPQGAKAGQVSLEPCDYATEDGEHPAECGTLVVHENRADPRSRLIALPIVRVHAKTDRPAEPIFHLEGGPGLSNMDFPTANRFLADHDVVLVGYRGVDGSSRLDCPEVTSALRHATDLVVEETHRAYADAFRACAKRLSDAGTDLDGYSLAQRVDDMEAARVALGYDRINLLSESAGTRTAMIYSWRHPARLHRSVMIGVNPPGHFLWDPATTDAQLRRYAELCAEDDTCRARTDDLAESMRRTSAQPPDRWLFLPIKPGNARVAAFFGLFDSTSTASIPAPTTLDSWLAAAEGDPSGLWFASFAADLLFPTSFVWGEWAATGTIDHWAAADHYSSGARPGDSILHDAGTEFVWGGGTLGDAWPTSPDDEEYRRVRTTEVETLLIGGTLDFSTPPRNATEELLPFLPNGHQVVLADLGHTTDFWTSQPDAGTRLITTYLDNGEVDDSLYQPARVDFTPSVTHPTLARITVGTMVGIALLTVFSLLWMTRRVRKRGAFGRTAGATLRSAYPLVLGLGGWFLGALVILTAVPGVPLDDDLVTAVSVGVPIGLGVHLARVHRDWSAHVKITGLAAAAAGALVGAWLGFHATEGFLALITTIVGATLGANLILLTLDIAGDRSTRRGRIGASGTDVDPTDQ